MVYVKHLWLQNFRSYEELDISLPKGKIILLGDNGQGKSNFIEAVGFLGTAQSFRSAPTEALIKQGCETSIIRAEIPHLNRELLVEEEISKGNIVIVAGFQGATSDMDITTLGRGASDLTAVALAAALNAERCEIYTDVDGIYTADPRLVPEARKLNHIGFEEMLELANYGAKMNECKVAVIGATGAVGQVFLKIAEERQFPISQIRLCASERSLGKTLIFNSKEVPLELCSKELLEEVDFAFISASGDISKKYAHLAAEVGTVALLHTRYLIKRTDYSCPCGQRLLGRPNTG